MYKICKTEQSAARQRELEQVLLSQMQQHRFDEISISDLCSSVGIPRKAFYRYFSGKRGALYALIDHNLADFDANVLSFTNGLSVGTRQHLILFLEWWRNQKDLLDAIENSSLWDELNERITEYIIAELCRARETSPAKLSEDEIYTMNFSIGGVLHLFRRWYHSGFPFPASHLADIILGSMGQ